jgi:hypothetical protein
MHGPSDLAIFELEAMQSCYIRTRGFPIFNKTVFLRGGTDTEEKGGKREVKPFVLVWAQKYWHDGNANLHNVAFFLLQNTCPYT